MIKAFVILLLSLGLSSCATLKKSFCDCAQGHEGKTSSAEHARSSEKIQGSKDLKDSGKESGIVVDSGDLDMGNRMSKAVDAFVFKNQKEDFTALCKDEHFDCFVNDKRFPKGKKKVKRKVPAFLSGSKMGLQGETRIRVKYDYYP